jgi:ATP-dependent Clp protease protease subunit
VRGTLSPLSTGARPGTHRPGGLQIKVATTPFGTGIAVMASTPAVIGIRPFRIDIPQSGLDDLHDRLDRTRWPDGLPGVGRTYGVPSGHLRELVRCRRHDYGRRAAEARPNAWPRFPIEIDGAQLHFAHIRSPGPDATPLVVTHGWPGAIVAFVDSGRTCWWVMCGRSSASCARRAEPPGSAGSGSAEGRETVRGHRPRSRVESTAHPRHVSGTCRRTRGEPMTPLTTLAPRAEEGDTPPTRFDDHLAAQLLAQRIVLLGTQVDEVSANRVCSQLLILSAEDAHTDISLYINSPGGAVHAGLAIYDTMRLIPNDVSTLAMGFAASMGQFLLSVGAPGKRYALPNARIMMHQPSAGIGGTTADIEIQAENLEFTKRTIERITAEHTGQSQETISRDGDRDRWFTAEEAREYGMVDRVVESLADVRPAATRRRMGLQ